MCLANSLAVLQSLPRNDLSSLEHKHRHVMLRNRPLISLSKSDPQTQSGTQSTHTHTRTHTHTHTHMHACTHACPHTHTHKTHACIHARTHARTHTHRGIHTHTQTPAQWVWFLQVFHTSSLDSPSDHTAVFCFSFCCSLNWIRNFYWHTHVLLF